MGSVGLTRLRTVGMVSRLADSLTLLTRPLSKRRMSKWGHGQVGGWVKYPDNKMFTTVRTGVSPKPMGTSIGLSKCDLVNTSQETEYAMYRVRVVSPVRMFKKQKINGKSRRLD